MFPNLQLVDLRENPNIDCRLVLELKISVGSECKRKASLITQQSLLRTTSLPIRTTFLITQQLPSPNNLVANTHNIPHHATIPSPNNLVANTHDIPHYATIPSPNNLVANTLNISHHATILSPNNLLLITNIIDIRTKPHPSFSTHR